MKAENTQITSSANKNPEGKGSRQINEPERIRICFLNWLENTLGMIRKKMLVTQARHAVSASLRRCAFRRYNCPHTDPE